MAQDKNQKSLTSVDSNREVYTQTKAELQDKLEEYIALVGILKINLEQALKEVDEKDLRIKHLENILTKQTPMIGGVPELDEVTIAKIQLQKLGTAAVQRELTNEEARRFEIFSKVIQNNEKKVLPPPSPLKDVSPARLIEIASAKPKKTEDSDV
jgi:hypothetical protein